MSSRKGFVYDTTSRADPGDISPELSDYANVVDEGTLANGAYDSTITGLTASTTYYFRAFGYDDIEDDYVYGDELSFATPAIAEISLNPATDIGFSSATLNSTVDTLNVSSVQAYFQYRETGAGTWVGTTEQTISTTGPVSEGITGLDVSTEYEFRFVVEDGAEQEVTSTLTFITDDLDSEVIKDKKDSSVTLFGVEKVTGVGGNPGYHLIVPNNSSITYNNVKSTSTAHCYWYSTDGTSWEWRYKEGAYEEVNRVESAFTDVLSESDGIYTVSSSQEFYISDLRTFGSGLSNDQKDFIYESGSGTESSLLKINVIEEKDF